MFDYSKEKNYYKVTLENGKTFKIDSKWVENSMTALELDEFSTIEMWLEDNDYLENEELNELDEFAKANKVKVKAETPTAKKKTQRERVVKENPEKEKLISNIAETLQSIAENVTITNKSKLIEFKIGENEYKVDLICKRKPKNKEKN